MTKNTTLDITVRIFRWQFRYRQQPRTLVHHSSYCLTAIPMNAELEANNQTQAITCTQASTCTRASLNFVVFQIAKIPAYMHFYDSMTPTQLQYNPFPVTCYIVELSSVNRTTHFFIVSRCIAAAIAWP